MMFRTTAVLASCTVMACALVPVQSLIVRLPPGASLPGTNTDSNNDGISDKCEAKLRTMCDPTADALVYDTCIAAKVCEADGFCTYNELLKFSNKVCDLVAVTVGGKCVSICSPPPGGNKSSFGRPQPTGPTSIACRSCREETFRSGGCVSSGSVDAVVLRYLNKLNDGTCKAENAAAAAAAKDVDLDKDGLTDDCEAMVEATCNPSKEANNYDECLSANACAFAKACNAKELTTFAINYCELLEKNLEYGACKDTCLTAGAESEAVMECGRCLLTYLLPAGCEFDNLTTQNLKIVDAVYNNLQMGQC